MGAAKPGTVQIWALQVCFSFISPASRAPKMSQLLYNCLPNQILGMFFFWLGIQDLAFSTVLAIPASLFHIGYSQSCCDLYLVWSVESMRTSFWVPTCGLYSRWTLWLAGGFTFFKWAWMLFSLVEETILPFLAIFTFSALQNCHT